MGDDYYVESEPSADGASDVIRLMHVLPGEYRVTTRGADVSGYRGVRPCLIEAEVRAQMTNSTDLLRLERDVMAALRSVSDLRDLMDSKHYGVAGHFTSFLVSEHGIENVVAFVDDQGGVNTIAQLDALFIQHFGEGLERAIERYRSDYPSCFHLARTRHPVECSRPPIEPDEDGYINFRYDLTCDDPEALGPVGGWMWHSFTFDVTRADGYDVSNAIMPFDFTAELVDCERGCGGSYTWSDTGIFLWAPDLEPGRHLVRFTRPVEQPGPVTIGMGRFE